MNIKPLADRVLINPTPAEEVTMAGIIIPDSAKEKPLKGTVLATGDGTKDETMVVKAGRHGSLWQVCRNRDRSRWRKVHDHASERYSGDRQ